MNPSIVVIFLLLLGQFSEHAFAFPEMARAGYVNCSSCHLNLAGGGLLNDYGRQLSLEELAVWKSSDKSSKENQFGFGVMDDSPIQKWLKLGGDFRGVYYYVNSQKYSSAKYILMQSDFQAAAVKEKWTLLATLGVTQLNAGQTVEFIPR